MRYYLVDNGMTYSDHSIYFVMSQWPRELVLRVFERRGFGEYTVVAEFAQPPTSIKEGPWTPLEEHSSCVQLAEQDMTLFPTEFLRNVLEEQKKSEANAPYPHKNSDVAKSARLLRLAAIEKVENFIKESAGRDYAHEQAKKHGWDKR